MDKTIEHRLAWLAGILDGEGYISFGLESADALKKRQTRYRTERQYFQARWNVEVCNTDAAMLNEIMAIATVLGIKYKYYDRAEQRRPNRKPMGRVMFHTRPACYAILTAVLPYLITKRSRAELLLRAIQHRASIGQGHARRPGWVPAINDPLFVEMFEAMKRMNHRGTAPVRGE